MIIAISHTNGPSETKPRPPCEGNPTALWGH
jgi:hypothetical protein